MYYSFQYNCISHSQTDAFATSGSYFGPAPDDVPIWLDNVNCEPDTSNLALCHHRPVGKHNCKHISEDAGVICNCKYSQY